MFIMQVVTIRMRGGMISVVEAAMMLTRLVGKNIYIMVHILWTKLLKLYKKTCFG